MITHATKPGKSASKSTVTFDATKFRNRYNPSFAVGLMPPTRWTGQHDYSPFTQDDLDWLAEVTLADSLAQIDAEEQAYHDMLDQLALEDAMTERYCSGFCL